jgi:glycosyltransferase involved in cell wall biosynthesis
MPSDVIIPARNEETTIGAIVELFAYHPLINQVIVVCDSCTDDTQLTAIFHGAEKVLSGGFGGKGQAVSYALQWVTTERVIFCDADITGLRKVHVTQLATYYEGMVIGVPDFPRNLALHRQWSWPWVSGQRAIPTALVKPLELHGYLMETQINAAARDASLPLSFESLKGVIAPYEMTEQRLDDMTRDAIWGKEHGIL